MRGLEPDALGPACGEVFSADAVKGDAAGKESPLVKAYVARVERCVQAKDVSLCPSTDYVMPQDQRR